LPIHSASGVALVRLVLGVVMEAASESEYQ
jgi:hypothetical protein